MKHFCKTHPAYAAKREPRSRCVACWNAWRAKQAVYKYLALAANAAGKFMQTENVTTEARWPRGSGIHGIAAIKIVSMLKIPPKVKPAP